MLLRQNIFMYAGAHEQTQRGNRVRNRYIHDKKAAVCEGEIEIDHKFLARR